MEQLSPRIQDEHIRRSVKKTAKKRHPWRIVWLIVLVLVVGAGGYAWSRFAEYGAAKADVLLEEGAAHERNLEYTAALDTYRQAQALGLVASSQAAQAAYRSGQLYESRGNDSLSLALEAYRNAYKLDAALPEYWEAAALVLFEQNDAQGLDELFDTAPNYVKTSPHLQTVAARRALGASQENQARDLLAGINDFAPATLLASALSIVDDTTSAVSDLERISEELQRPSDIALAMDLLETKGSLSGRSELTDYLSISQIALEANYPDVALVHADNALREYENSRDGLVYQAAAQVDLGQLDAAEQTLEQAQDTDPTYGYVRYIKAQLALKRGNDSDAVLHLQDAILLGYDVVDVYLELVDHQIALGDLDDAEKTLLDAIDAKSQPELYVALFWLFYTDAQDLDAARDVFDDFEEAYPRDAHIPELAALIATDKENSNAQEQAEALLERDPQSAMGYLVRGIVAHDQADLARAIDLDTEGYIGRAARLTIDE